MKYQPFPYQVEAQRRILEQPAVGVGVGLFLEMGMGKTVATLTAVDELIYDRCEVSRVLVIAPLRVAEDTWSREAAKWEHLQHLRIAKALGTEAQRRAALMADADIYIINRENVEWLVGWYERQGLAWPFDMVVIDELSSFKSSKAKRFRALRKVRPLIRRLVGLTGTPAPNGLIDLWPQIYLLDRGQRLGRTVTGYRDQYFTPGRRNRTTVFEWVPKPGADKEIQEAISDICVSMSAKDWLQLPERIDRVVPIQLPPAAVEQYKELEKEWLLELGGGDVVAGSGAVVTGKLLQIVNGAVYDERRGVHEIHTEKLLALSDIIEAANGKPVLVFYSFLHDRDRISSFLAKQGLHPRQLESSKDIANWNDGRISVLLAHPASAGHGLNLQAGGNIIVWFGLPWSLELYQQANARLYRQGQQQAVIIHHIVAEGTIDEDVLKALNSKADGQAVLLEAIKARIQRIIEGSAA